MFLPTAIRWKAGTFARSIGSDFSSSQVGSSRDCNLRTHQTLRRHTKIFERGCYLRLNNVSHVAVGRTVCHAGTIGCETLYRSFIRAPVGTDSDRAASSLPSRLEQKKQERWEEAVNSIDFSHSSRFTVSKYSAWRFQNIPFHGLSLTFHYIFPQFLRWHYWNFFM